MRTIIAGLLALVANSVQAYGTAHELVRDCTVTATNPTEAFRERQCFSYVSGVLDGYGVVRDLYKNVRIYCEPTNGMTVDTALSAVVEWLRCSPDRASVPARSGILLALRERYPCK